MENIDIANRYQNLINYLTDYIYTVKIKNGAAVETLHGPGCVSVTGYTSDNYKRDPELWYRMVHDKDREKVLEQAKKKQVGILARVPLASGMLAGKFTKDSKFEKDDHRRFNRHGEDFDKGETFSGVDYDLGLKAVEELKDICPAGITLTQFALRWILMFDAVTCTIPGAKRKNQVEENISSVDLPPLTDETMKKVNAVYEKHIKESVHQYW